MVTEPVKPEPECPHCGGTGWERSGQSSMRHCRCLTAGRSDRLLAEARIPRRYEHCGLDSFRPNDPSQARAKADASRFLEKYPTIDVGLLFLGPAASERPTWLSRSSSR